MRWKASWRAPKLCRHHKLVVYMGMGGVAPGAAGVEGEGEEEEKEEGEEDEEESRGVLLALLLL